MTTRKKLLNIKGISEAKVDKIKVCTCSYNLQSGLQVHYIINVANILACLGYVTIDSSP